MENAEVARILGETADLMELTGENPFKVRAYRQAARVIDLLPGPVSELWSKGTLTELPSIGAGLAERIEELLTHGTCHDHERLATKVPAGVVELLRLEGVGPKTISNAWKLLGITDVDELEDACRSGRVLELPRMGEARAEAIVAAIGRYRRRRGRTPLHRALLYARTIVDHLERLPQTLRIETAGSVRRRVETVGDLDILVATRDAEPVMRAFCHMPEVADILAEGPTKSAVRLRSGLQVDLRALAPESFGAAMHYFTGSKSHNIALRTLALHKGIKLSEYGVFDREGHRLSGEHEQDVFAALGLPWIPPELREGAGEIEAAFEGRLPVLVREEDLRGDLHVHTDASQDARSTLEELTQEAARLGRAYLAVTDHSRARPLGLDLAAVVEQGRGISRLDGALRGRPHLLRGVEVDILPDGSLDLPAEGLSALDWVVASVHSHFDQSEEEMTGRIVKALRSGVVDVLGHPTGRILGRRDPYPCDLSRILEVAKQEGVALELNAMPERLDLNDRACRLAKEAGVPIAIDSDAHHASQLDNLRFGVWAARRGWLEKQDVLNTRSFEELRAWRRRRAGSAAPATPARRVPTTPRKTRA